MLDPQEIVELTHYVKNLVTGEISDINDINRETTFLTLNALIGQPAARASAYPSRLGSSAALLAT